MKEGRLNIKKRAVSIPLVAAAIAVAAGSFFMLRPGVVRADAINNTDFVMTVKSDNAGASGNNQFTIPTTSTGYNYTVDCNNDGTPELTNQTGDATCTFGAPGTHTIRIGGTFPRIYFNDAGDKLKLLSVDQWGTGTWASMAQAFSGASNMDVKAADTPKFGNNVYLSGMFKNASSLQGASANWNWDTSKVVSLSNAFEGATRFNADISSWNVGKVTEMQSAFKDAKAFNQNLGAWDLSSATNIGAMFQGATTFNNGGSDAIKGWNTAKVTSMDGTFNGATSFNQPLNWDTSHVTAMRQMFNNATSFNQSLANFNVTSLRSTAGGAWLGGTNMLNNTALSRDNYDNTLIAWAAQNVQTGVSIGAVGLKYCQGDAARTSLINNKQWTFTGDAKDPACMPPAAPTAAPDMTAATDSGDSDSDNVTNNKTPSFVVKCTANGTTIKLYVDNVQAATANCTGAGDITVPLTTPLADKAYSLTYTESNAFGESPKSQVLGFTVDTTAPAAPQITISPIATDDVIDQTEATQQQTITGTVAGAKDRDPVELTINGVRKQASLDGNRFTFTVPGADLVNNPDKKVTVSVTTKDVAGNAATGTQDRPYTVNNTPTPAPAAPTLKPSSDTGVSNSDNITNQTAPTVILTCQNATDKLHIYVNGTSLQDVQCTQAGPVEVALNTLGQGQRRVAYTVENAAGNVSAPSAELSLEIDTTAPQANVQTSGTFTTIPDIKGSTNDTNATVVVTIGGVDYPATNNAGTWTVPASALAALGNGVHDFTVKVTDVAGNVATIHSSFTLNLPTPPTPPTPQPQPNPANPAPNDTAKPEKLEQEGLADTGTNIAIAVVAGVAMIAAGSLVIRQKLAKK